MQGTSLVQLPAYLCFLWCSIKYARNSSTSRYFFLQGFRKPYIVLCCQHSFRFSAQGKLCKVLPIKNRSSGRAAEGDGLENRCTERYRGFESLLLRLVSLCVVRIAWVAASSPKGLGMAPLDCLKTFPRQLNTNTSEIRFLFPRQKKDSHN